MSAAAGPVVGGSAELLLPDEVAAAVGRVPPASLVLRVGLVVTLLWASLRLVRALRTAVPATCGQTSRTSTAGARHG